MVISSAKSTKREIFAVARPLASSLISKSSMRVWVHASLGGARRMPKKFPVEKRFFKAKKVSDGCRRLPTTQGPLSCAVSSRVSLMELEL
jgi:hypothetical protein